MLKKILSILLVLVIVIGTVTVLQDETQVNAAEKINKKKLTLTVGKTYKIKIKSAKTKYTWTSEDTSIVKVKTKKGKSTKITALSAGKTTITATNTKGKKFTCTVTVKGKNNTSTPTPTPEPKQDYIYLYTINSGTNTPISVKVGDKIQMSLGVNKTVKRYYINDSDKNKLSVDDYGLVTALAAGSGYVKVETTDYNYYTVQVNVSEGNVTTDLPKVTTTPIPTSTPAPTNMPTVKPTEVPKATPTATPKPTTGPKPTAPELTNVPIMTESPTATPAPTNKPSVTATPTPVTTKAPTPTPKLANPYLSPDHATIKINEKYQINLIGTYIMFCYENTWDDVYAEIDPTGVITGKMECKNAVINILGEDGNTYRFYLTVSGYTDPVEDQPEVLTEEDIKLNKILYNDIYGILKKSTKKTYTEELYYDVTDRTSLIKAAHDGLEKGAKKIHFRFTDHDTDYWQSEFSYIRQYRGESGSYTTMYSIEKGTNEIILKPTYKDGWNVVLAMRYKDYEISEKAEKVWREAYKLASEAYKQHPDNVREILSYINKELCDMVEYTYSNTDHDDASGIFLDHKGVCAGYSSAVSLLCNILGIDNMVIFSSDGEHSWNYVKIDGNWYHLDVTFNDSLRSDGTYRNDYFLITDEELVEVSKNYQHPEYHAYEEIIK